MSEELTPNYDGWTTDDFVEEINYQKSLLIESRLQLAAKDRTVSEQAAVIERARQGVIIAIEFVEGRGPRSYEAIRLDLIEILSGIGASTLGDAEPALTSRNIPACSPSASDSALPVPQPVQVPPPSKPRPTGPDYYDAPVESKPKDGSV